MLPSHSTPIGERKFSDSAARLYFCLHPSYFCCVRKCPTCGKPVEWEANPWRPFCSERCKLIDFDKWTSEEYRVAGRQISRAEVAEDLSTSETENGGVSADHE